MIIGGSRGCGKTTEMIKIAHEEDLYIVCGSKQRVKHIADLAREMELNIRFPVSVSELPLKSNYIKRVLVDDIEDVLSYFLGKPIHTASTSLEIKKLEL
jgi:hypothetical protein